MNYPNGLRSYLETLVAVASEIDRQGYNISSALHPEFAIEWAEEFEHIHNGRIWDGEWLEEIEDFVRQKLAL
jgi:hypothetical protein